MPSNAVLSAVNIFDFTGYTLPVVVPAGVTQIYVYGWGRGGVGDTNYGTSATGTYVEGYLRVYPGEKYLF